MSSSRVSSIENESVVFADEDDGESVVAVVLSVSFVTVMSLFAAAVDTVNDDRTTEAELVSMFRLDL